MPRMYVLNSWVGSCEYDEGDTYSGEQIGNRNQRSVEVRMSRDGDSWKASTIPKKPRKQPSLRDSILLADRHLNRLEGLSERLENEYLLGEVGTNDYLLMRRSLDKRLQKAWLRVERENGWTDSEPLAQHEEPIEQINYTSYNESPIVSSPAQEIFSSLSDGNVFKIAYIKIKRIAEALK